MASHSPVSVRTYVTVYVSLLLLTLLTVALSRAAHLDRWEVVAALGIASVKTILVGAFFMHLIYSSKLTWLILAAGVLFFAILLTLTLTDYWTRGLMPA